PVAAPELYPDIRQYHKDCPGPSVSVGSPTTGAPKGFVIFGNPMAIRLGPYPNTAFTFVMTGAQWLPQLVADTDTNWYLVNAPDALLYLSCVEAAVWLQDDALAGFYQKLGVEKVRQIRRSLRE